jgi:heme exporter protein C
MRVWLLAISFFVILISGLSALTVAAVEPISRNIVYIHAPAAICSIACFCVLFICSLQYLITRRQMWDYVAAASAEVGLVFATVLNATGSIFARAEWGLWWTPSPRLISSAVLWFLCAAYLILRAGFTAERRKETVCAVFGIIAFIDVPLIFISARFIRDIHRPSFSFQTGWQYAAFGLSVCGTGLLAALLILIKSDVLKVKNEMDMKL